MRYFRRPFRTNYRPRCRLLQPCSEWLASPKRSEKGVVRRRFNHRDIFIPSVNKKQAMLISTETSSAYFNLKIFLAQILRKR